MAKYNNVVVKVDNMDFHNLLYEDNFFDIIHGSCILHHIDCSIVGKEIYRVLKPGGIAFFRENSDRNLILRFLRRLLFGKPGGYQKQKFLFIKRTGTSDEYPLTEEEVEVLVKIFKGNIRVTNEYFYFFSLLNSLIFKNSTLGNLLWTLDSLIGNVFPFIKKYSFFQEIWLKKPE
jgi:ubiquinone/menaquinone biosynthesis C-methylase UbiE